jgi:hypothetical protein
MQQSMIWLENSAALIAPFSEQFALTERMSRITEDYANRPSIFLQSKL